jgi:hypothetical protein
MFVTAMILTAQEHTPDAAQKLKCRGGRSRISASGRAE